MPTPRPDNEQSAADAPSATAKPRSEARGEAATVVGGASTSPAPQPSEILRLGPYTLTRMIASGGMGAVWEAIDGRLGRRVAVKVMLRDDARPEAVERFHREALHAAKLRHPNIVAVLDVGHDRGRRYLVMDLIEGPTLDAALRERPLTWREKAGLVETIARAVQYAHEQGVVHRDLKPANILLRRDATPTRALRRAASSTARVQRKGSTPSGAHDAAPPLGEPLVMDFGLAMDVAEDSHLSRDGQAMGTPSYMPPEQAEGRREEIGPRSDVYGLGAILYEALTGRPPFIGETPARIIRAVVEDEPPPPGRIAEDVPRDLETICLRCLAKEPAKRYETAGALADDLAAWLAGDPIAARRASSFERLAKRVRKNPSAWIAGSTAVLVSVVGLAALLAFLVVRRAEAVAHAAALDRLVDDMRAEQARRETVEAERQRLQQERDREWQLVFEDRFDGDDLATRWDVVSEGGVAEVAGGQLHLRDGGPQVALPRGRFTGDLRLEFTCRQTGPLLTDISAFLAGSPEAASWLSNVQCYLFQYGGHVNTQTRLLRDGQTVLETHPAPIEAGRTYRVVAQRLGGRLTYAIDGRTILDYADPRPLSDADRPRVGIYGWDADTWIDDVRVYRLGEPRSADVLDLVERRLQRGETLDAGGLVDEVLASTSDPERAARAQRARDALEVVRRRGEAVARVRAVVAAAWPGATVTATSDGAAVDLAGLAIDDLRPLAGLPLARLSCARTRVADLAPLAGMPLVELDVSATGVTSLAPLAGMPLRTLRCASSNVRDLAPLAGMPLEELMVQGSPVADLAPLAGMRLHALQCQRSQVADLAPLAGMPLATLDCSDTKVRSLAPLAGMPLRDLGIDNLRLTDLEGVRGLRLGTLTCARNAIVSLAPLEGMALSSLGIADNDVADLSPIARLPLVGLDAGGNRISSLEPLRGMPLVSLGVGDNPLSDLAPLAGSHLSAIDLSRDPISDLSPLAGMRLQDVRITDTAVRDLAALAGAPLDHLDCSGCAIATLAGLDLRRLVQLQCRRTAIADLSPLRAATALDRLWCGDSPVASFAALAGRPLHELEAVGVPARDLDALVDAPPVMLLVDPGPAPEDLARAWRRRVAGMSDPLGTLRPILSTDGATLRAGAAEFRGHRYALLPGYWTWSEAGAACRAVGGHLATFADDDEAAFAAGRAYGMSWIGLCAVSGEPRWIDATPPPPIPRDRYGDHAAFACTLAGRSVVIAPIGGHDAHLRQLYALVEWDD